MRVGILGGTFDPVHNGHIAIAYAAKEQYDLDRVFLMPACIPPHKRSNAITPDTHRLEMLQLALQSEDGLAINLTEFARGGVSYTSDTLTALLSEHPDSETYYIMGEDSLRDFPTWHEPETIARLVKILVAIRQDNDETFRELLAERNRQYNNAFLPLNVPYCSISSTALRRTLINGGVTTDINPKVMDYIDNFGVYTHNPKALRKETIRACEGYLEKLSKEVSEHRFLHLQGVAYTAADLMLRHLRAIGAKPDADGCFVGVQQAFIAGVLHDCAKGMSGRENYEFSIEHGLVPEDFDEKYSETLHAPVGKWLAEHTYGITDPVILTAIEQHCLGDVDMSDVSQAVYVADYIEPGREFEPALMSMNKLRKVAYENLLEGAYLAACSVIRFLQDIKADICPKSFLTADALKERLKWETNTVKSNSKEKSMKEYQSIDLAKTAFQALEDKKGYDIRVIKIENITTIADYFVIADGNNPSQVEAMVDEVQMKLYKEFEIEPKRIEGARNSGWILMDYGDIVVHVFSSQDRLFYDLERVWRDGESLDTTEWKEVNK